ncbi:mutator protein MutT [Inhella inkyongensis]|uniref:Phosphoribosyl-AMP cyclohydrolase n=1 Tax=Inhella inkyongensis TaxID=392593 RepID=A0A840S4B4_9BURK|nr:mutator protein MutT [Inhella inkyongensis]
MTEEQAQERKAVDVAVGVLVRRDAQGREDEFLLTSRPPGKVYPGHWEFPGGKFEAGEDAEAALRRELQEELGITIGSAHPWRIEVMDYPHARVRLHFLKVFDWSGELQMHEGQRMAWQRLPVQVWPVLPGTVPVLDWFASEAGFAGVTHASRLPAQPTWLDAVAWDERGLVPAIAQEAGSKDVLMVAWMNREALLETWARGQAVYWSRSRQRLWHKGEESGHVQTVLDVRLDCDRDVVLLTVRQEGHEGHGVACHTGRHSCFFHQLDGEGWAAVEPVLVDPERIYR